MTEGLPGRALRRKAAIEKYALSYGPHLFKLGPVQNSRTQIFCLHDGLGKKARENNMRTIMRTVGFRNPKPGQVGSALKEAEELIIVEHARLRLRGAR